jgi:4-hydroxybenzoyl-CoA thioesterase
MGMSDATHVDLAAASTEFRRPRLIRFSDCDPAGIVFYPQYFVMLNGLVEDWVNEGLGLSYHALVARAPHRAADREARGGFRAVSRMGDRVTLGLAVERLGSRSMTLACAASVPSPAKCACR